MSLQKTLLSVLPGLCLLSIAAQAAPVLPTRPYLNLTTAQSLAQAAEKKALESGWPCVIAVVDEGGLPLVLLRMDNAAVPAGVELAPGKARTAALFHRPSSDLENAINGKRPAAATARGFVLMSGGLPVSVGGQVVGGIGVSSDTPEHDVILAQAGLDALK